MHNGQFCSHILKDNRKIEETCSKYAGSAKLNGIPRKLNTEIPIKSYKYQCRDNMIINGMWGVFFLPYPLNKEKKWGIYYSSSVKICLGIRETPCTEYSESL